MSGLVKEIYIVVAECDGTKQQVENGVSIPIAFESNSLDLESAKKFQKRIGLRYGKTAIYKAEKLGE